MRWLGLVLAWIIAWHALAQSPENSGHSPLTYRGRTPWTPEFVDWYGEPLNQPHAGQDENHQATWSRPEAIFLGAGRVLYLRESAGRRYDVRVVLGEGGSFTEASAGLPFPFHCQRLLRAANGTVFLFGASFPNGTAGVYEPKRLCEVWTLRPPEKGVLPKWKCVWKEDPRRASDQLQIEPGNLEIFENDLIAQVRVNFVNNQGEERKKIVYKFLKSNGKGEYIWANLFADGTEPWESPLRCAPGRSYPVFQFTIRQSEGLPGTMNGNIPVPQWQLLMQVAKPGKDRTRGLVFEQPIPIWTLDNTTIVKINTSNIFPLDSDEKLLILYYNYEIINRELVNGWYQGFAYVGVVFDKQTKIFQPIKLKYQFNSQFTKEKDTEQQQLIFTRIVPIKNNVIFYISSGHKMHYLPAGSEEIIRLDSLAHAYIEGFSEQPDQRLGIFVSAYQTEEEKADCQRKLSAEAARSKRQLEASNARDRRRKMKEFMAMGFGVLVFAAALATGGFTASRIIKGGQSMGRVIIASMLFLGLAIGGGFLGMFVAFIIAVSMGLVGSH